MTTSVAADCTVAVQTQAAALAAEAAAEERAAGEPPTLLVVNPADVERCATSAEDSMRLTPGSG